MMYRNAPPRTVESKQILQLHTRNHNRKRSIVALVAFASVISAVAFGRPRHQDNRSRSGSETVVGITSAIHPSDKLLSTILRPAVYARIAIQLDDAEGIFQRAHYQPVWTQSAEEAKRNNNLPTGCTVVPHETRSWEPWFRNTLKNGDKVLSTADLLLVGDAIGLAINRDPRTRFCVPNGFPESKLCEYWAGRIEAVRIETLLSLGIDKPSTTLTQFTMTQAAGWFVTGQSTYGTLMTEKYFDRRVWATGNQLLNNPSFEVTCNESSMVNVYLLRSMERIQEAQGHPTGIQARSLHCTWYKHGPKDPLAHGIVGVSINCGSGSRANVYYDSVPWIHHSNDRFKVTTIGTRTMGPLDQVSIESFCDTYLVWVLKDEASALAGVKPARVPDARFGGGENAKGYGIGNFAPFADGKNGVTEVGTQPLPNDGYMPFHHWRANNDGPITSFQNTVNGIFRF